MSLPTKLYQSALAVGLLSVGCQGNTYELFSQKPVPKKDTLPPQVELMSYLNIDDLNRLQLQVKVEDDSCLDSVVLLENGTPIKSFKYQEIKGRCSRKTEFFSYDVSQQDGTFSYTLKATDGAGNENSDSFTAVIRKGFYKPVEVVRQDRDGPVIGDVNVRDEGDVNVRDLNLSTLVKDGNVTSNNSSGIFKVAFYVDGKMAKEQHLESSVFNHYMYIEVSVVAGGEHTFSVEAEDFAGNVTRTSEQKVKFEDTFAALENRVREESVALERELDEMEKSTDEAIREADVILKRASELLGKKKR